MIRSKYMGSIRAKILLIVITALIGFVIDTSISLRHLKAELLENRKSDVRHAVETAYGILTFYSSKAMQGALSEQEAKDESLRIIRGMRYEEKEYFWVNDMHSVMLMHPYKPELEGRDLSGFQDPSGKRIFTSFVSEVEKRGAGFVDYLWPKPGHEEPLPKVSYVKGFQPWGWIIGSGLYLDDIDTLFWKELKSRVLMDSVIVAVMLLLSWLLGRSIVGRLQDTVHAVALMSQGDGELTRRLDADGNDELSELAGNLNLFLSKIQRMLQSIAGSALQLSNSFTELSNVSEETSRAVAKQQDETHHVVTAINQLAASVQEVAQNTANAADAAQKADEEALSGRHMVEENRQAIEKLAKEVEQAAQVIQELEQETDGIGGVLGVIQAIAEQTNLLALNAAIEAARAGEQGRGFAVVADEVRTLAQRTQDATTQIQDAIGRLQESTGKAVSVMEMGRISADDSVKKAVEAGSILSSISESVSIIRDMNTQIASATEEQAAVTNEVRANLDTISGLAESTSKGAAETDRATIRLTEEVEALQNQIMQFNLGEKVLDLETAKSMHLNWKVKLRAFLDGEALLTREQAVSHKHCDFGKWYYDEGLARFGNITALREIEAPHAKMHQLIADIITARERGELDKAEQLYTQIGKLSDRIVGLMEQVEYEAG